MPLVSTYTDCLLDLYLPYIYFSVVEGNPGLPVYNGGTDLLSFDKLTF